MRRTWVSGWGSPQFLIATNNFRTATSSSNPVVGAEVCEYGKTTIQSCDIVEASSICVTYTGFPQYCGLFKTRRNFAAGGDSEGPWFFGNRAHGITSGIIPGDADLFSGVGSLNLLSVIVVTG